MLQKMNILDFIQYTKEHESEWRNYCEILLDKYGNVYLARPCHQNAALELAASLYNQSIYDYRKEIPKYCSPLHWIISKENFVSVWYEFIIMSKDVNRFQKHSIDLLKESGLIDRNGEIKTTIEYEQNLLRQKLDNGEISLDVFISEIKRLKNYECYNE